MDCPNDQDLLTAVQRENAAEAALLWRHINGCEACLELATLVRLANAPTAATAPRGGWHGWPTVAGRAGADLRYAMGPEIARGGMGSIIAAWDVHLDREVAFKLASDEAAAARRFQREIAITSELEHPAIVPIHDSGTLPDGRPFYVMRLVGGTTLAQRIEQAGSATARLALLPNLIAVSDAVAFAHARGVVHRDLKPHNLLVGEFGESFVLDWGLAKRIDDNDASLDDTLSTAVEQAAWLPPDPHSNTTVIGQAVGTPAYMAPEQRSASIDAALPPCDVYALGATLQHLLVGAAPTPGASLGDDPRLQTAPVALVAIVKRATARSPSDRYPTASEFAADLRRFVDGQLVSAHRYTAWQRVRRWSRRHRGALAVAGIAVAALVVVSAVALQRIFAEQRATQQANVVATHQRDAAQNLVNFVLDNLRTPLQSAGREDLLADTSSAVLAYYAELPASAQSARQQIDAWLGAGQLALNGGNMDDALAAYDRADALLIHVADADRELWHCRIALARRAPQLARGQKLDGDTTSQECMASAERALAAPLDVAKADEWRRLAVKAMIERAEVLAQQHDKQAVIALNQRILEITAPLVARNDRAGLSYGVRGNVNLAGYHRDAMQFEAADQAVTRCLAVTQQILTNLPNDIMGQYATAACEIEAGRAREQADDLPGQKAAYDRAYDAAKQLVAREPKNKAYRGMLAYALERQAWIAVRNHDNAAAEHYLMQCRDVFTRALLSDPQNVSERINVAASEMTLASFYGSDRPDKARPRFLAAIAEYERARAAMPTSLKIVDQLSVAHKQLMWFERELNHAAAANVAGQKALELAEIVYSKQPDPMMGARIATLLLEQIEHDGGNAKALAPRLRELAEPLRAATKDDADMADLINKIDALQR